ncbi:hypothetical protein V6Z11_A03G251200 [Gossypium hirsutum]
MNTDDLEGGEDDGYNAQGNRKYSPVGAQDRAVLEMASMDPGSSATASQSPIRKVRARTQGSMDSDGKAPDVVGGDNGPHREHKLELFGFDSLVNILGLKSMTQEQVLAPSSPRDNEVVSITGGDPTPSGVKMGTMMGVFVPCLQSILGIIYYIRFSWIIGMGGIADSLLLVSLCGLCTFLTGLSLSAIATNGAMKGGGPYYLIGRALGPEVGVSIGLCFFLGNAVAAALYVLGAVETFLKALPSAGFFTAGITGLSADSFKDNWDSMYQNTNSDGIPDRDGKVYWNFNALVGLFFPAVTGIMAGSNRSASLKDTQRSIPIGTLSATLVTTLLYLVSVFLFGAVANREKLLTDRLLTATIAWPFPVLIRVGIILSTLGAALQSLTGAPRLLAAIANDDILPVLNCFRVADTNAPSWRPRWKFHHWLLSLLGALLCVVIMFLISWLFTVVSLALASLIYYYVSIKGKAGDWGDGFKSAYFQLALRSLRSLGAKQVHPKNWYPIPLIFCRPWGKLPENVPCHPKLADFANCMKKKGRGMSIFVNILDGDYHECAEDAKEACKQLDTYINYKNCEGVAEIVVATNMTEGFRGIVQTMGLGNLKPNIVVVRYPEIWRRENLKEIPTRFVGIINDCIVANKAVVIVKGLDEWPNEYQRQYGSIDLYWIVRDGGLMLLLSQLLLTKESFESCKIQVFCIAEEDSDAECLKADVKKFLYDLRLQAEVIVITIKSWDVEGGSQQDDSIEAFNDARKRVASYLAELKEAAKREGTPLMADGKAVVVDEQQVEKFLYTTLKLNTTILRYSRMAAVVLVSLPPPPINHPAYCYMEYMDLLVGNVQRLLMVRGYRRDVVTLFT